MLAPRCLVISSILIRVQTHRGDAQVPSCLRVHHIPEDHLAAAASGCGDDE